MAQSYNSHPSSAMHHKTPASFTFVKKLAMKILLLRFSSIGDIVLTTPVIRCLHQQLPQAEIHYLTRSTYTPLLRYNPHIHKVWEFEKNLSEVISQLRWENFDFIADLHCNWRSYRLRMALRRPSSGFPKLNAKKWLLVNTRINLLPDIHVVDRYFMAVTKLGITNDAQGIELFIPPDETLRSEGLPERLQQGFIALVVGAKHPTKQIPESLALSIVERLPLPVMLLGGKEDHAKAENIVKHAGNKAVNACGKYSLLQSASALSLSQLVITGDTGLMHMATAFRKPMIVVWGNTVPAFGMGPYLPAYSDKLVWHAEVNNLPCRPCSKLGFPQCPRGHFKCMLNHSAEEIAEKAREMLSSMK